MAHRRIQSGGDPAQGPPRDVVESVPIGNDPSPFPDTPPQNRAETAPGRRASGGHGVDLDAFAERLGLRQREDDGERADGAGVADGVTLVVRRIQGTAGGALHGVARLAGTTSRALDQLARRIDPG